MLAYFVITPVLVAVLMYLFPKMRAMKLLAVGTQVVLAGFAYWLFALTKGGEIFVNIGGFYSIMGIHLRADLLSSMFVLLTTFFFLIAIIYSVDEGHSGLFWFLMFIWQASLIGIFLVADLFNIFIMMEVGAIIVTVLIMYDRSKRSMYDGFIYFALNVVVMQFYLFGLGYVYRLTGTMDMYVMAERMTVYHYPYLMLPYATIMTFVGLKAALVPMFGWLPKAHGSPAAPPAVSAVLSGLHIKAAIYLFIRFQDLFQLVGSTQFFLVIGIVTGIVGFILAMAQTDMKLILAYHTVSQVGLIFTGLSISAAYTPDGYYTYSFVGGMYHIINHALFKGGLFLSAGIIYKLYGTRNVYKVRGLLRTYPIIGVSTLMAILGITGAPFFNGSISKYFMVSDADPFLNAVLIFMSLGTIISFVKYSTMLFGQPPADFQDNKPAPSNLQVAMVSIMGILCFITGVFGVQTIYFLFAATVTIDVAGYIEKVGIFFASLAGGYLAYKHYVKKSTLLKKLRNFDMGFRTMIFGIGIFFGAVLILVGIVYPNI